MSQTTKTARPAQAPEYDVDFRARVAAFGLPAQTRAVYVDILGDVRVWDSVAGHYTTSHGLDAAAEARLVRRACKIARSW